MEKERERHIDAWEKHWLVASYTPPTGDLACALVPGNPVMCHNQELNWWTSGFQASGQSAELHQLELIFIHLKIVQSHTFQMSKADFVKWTM